MKPQTKTEARYRTAYADGGWHYHNNPKNTRRYFKRSANKAIRRHGKTIINIEFSEKDEKENSKA